MFCGRRRNFIFLFIAFLVTAVSLPQISAAQPLPRWGQTGLDNKPDPEILFGVLPNGMMYAVRHNATPPGQTAMRLMIKAGSMQEAKDQEGLAHFLEHMAFRGSKHVPDGEVVNTLQRLGLLFGADTNASTGGQMTIYKFNLASSDNVSIDTGLVFLREIASELTIDAKVMQTEKGVVLSEERLRDTPGLRAFAKQMTYFYGTHPFARMPIGRRSVIEKASAARARDFYNAYYRPERAVLVVVGDIDPQAIEAKIKAKFSDWKGKGPAGRDPGAIVVSRRAPETAGVVAEGLTSSLLIYWPQQFKFVPDTLAEDRRRIVEMLAFLILKQRVRELAADAGKPFSDFVVGPNKVHYVADGAVFQMSGVTNWRASLKLSVGAVRQILQFGVTQPEVDRAINNLNATLQASVTSSSTRQTAGLADSLVSSAFSGNVLTTPEQDLKTFETVVKSLTPGQINAELRDRFAGSGPLLFYEMPSLPPGDEAAIPAVFSQALNAPVLPFAAKTVKAWPYTDFGTPGTVAERRMDGADVAMVRFANGARLTVKPTDYVKGQVLVSVRFGHGRLDMPLDRVDVSRIASSLFVPGGLKDFTLPELQATLAGRVANVSLRMNDSSFSLEGSTIPADFQLQLQLMTAMITAPGWRSESFASLVQVLGQNLNAASARPSLVDSNKGIELRNSGDPRWKALAVDDLPKFTYDGFRAYFEPILTKSPLEVIIVGDIGVDQAVDGVAKTIGALPARSDLAVPADARKLKFPAPTPTPIELHHKGRADQGLAVLAWPTEGLDYGKPQNRFSGWLLEAILSDRVTQRIRMQQGATYSPSGEAVFSHTFTNYGYILLRVEIPPPRMAGFFADAEAIAADIAANGVTDDELVRARLPLVDLIKHEQRTNSFWLGCLYTAQTDPTVLPYCRNFADYMQNVSGADVQAAAKKWLRGDTAWRLTITPEPGAAASKP